jgi:integral membrane protein
MQSVNQESAEIAWLRPIGMLEGLSLLALLCVAMPLKYVWGIPLAVRVVGMAHGVFFLLYVGFLFNLYTTRRLTLTQCVVGFISASVPFGWILFDRYLKR